MHIDKIQAKIRPRSNWEAVDLGFLMANKWKANIYMVWFLVTMPFFVLSNLLFHDDMTWFILVFWLFIPIYDRFVLLVVSRRLFDEKITVVEVIRVAPRLIFKHFFKHLTYYRFDPARSFNLPVWFLENLSGSKRSARARILKISASGTASTLTTACSMLVFFFYLSILASLISFIPGLNLFGDIFRDSFENIIAMYQSQNWYVQLFANSLFYLAISLVEPFYVCAGFALYLNRRTELESWDIELSFKNLRNKLEEKDRKFEMAGVATKASKLAVIAVTTCILALTPVVFPSESYANTQGVENPTKRGGTCKAPREPVFENGVKRSFECIDWEEKLNEPANNRAEKELRALLSEEKYNKCSVVTKFERIPEKVDTPDTKSIWEKIWEYFFGDDDKEREKDDDSDEISFANIFEIIIWTLVGIGIVYLLVQLYKYREGLIEFFSPSSESNEDIPTEIFGLDITPESIPDQLSDEVLKLWEEGEHLKALALLYRGYLSKMIHTFNAEIRASYTENDCLNSARKVVTRNSHLISLFSQITDLWLKAAYAHRLPSDASVIDCCRSWRLSFEVGSATEASFAARKSKESTDA
ncbi:MAG: hypothetical protein D6B28_04490 [Gammaproteobacteria bacterium]|nr:MAG: hypothetical protein D6B28_04490 [Gammaproteobacteria bacterium]